MATSQRLVCVDGVCNFVSDNSDDEETDQDQPNSTPLSTLQDAKQEKEVQLDYATKKKHVTESLGLFIAQLKDGCLPVEVKPVCFSKYCRRNVLINHTFQDDKQLIKFALTTLSSSTQPKSLICPRSPFIVTR